MSEAVTHGLLGESCLPRGSAWPSTWLLCYPTPSLLVSLDYPPLELSSLLKPAELVRFLVVREWQGVV
jgi:hypothetical protein